MERDLASQAPADAVGPIATHDVSGGGGVRLHAREWGDPQGPGLLLIHGWSASQLCWAHQVGGPLAERFHIVTFDIRGHGMAGKPLDPESYGDARLWADDVAAVIERTGLKRPVVVAWSYGGYIVTDYVRVHGEDGIAAIDLAGAAVRLAPPAFDHLGPALLGNVEAACSPDLPASIAGTRRIIAACSARPMHPDDWDNALCSAMVVPSGVRGALLAREIDADDVLSGLSIPVLASHGRADAIVLPSMAEHVAEVCPGAELSSYDGVAHAPFMEEPARFARELGELASRAARSRPPGRDDVIASGA